MGKEWDAFVATTYFMERMFKSIGKPGGHLLSFAGTRTYDWDCHGFEISRV